jgi:hypothetical protein
MNIELTKDQVTGVVKLIDQEILRNQEAGDDAYNTYWDNIKDSLQS